MSAALVWEVYRYTHPDGSAKDWACARMTDGTGRWEVRWGKAGRLVGRQQGIAQAVLQHREQEKLGKGYRHLGAFCIDDRGNLTALPTATTARPSKRAASPGGPPTTARANGEPIDIAKLLGGGPGFYFD